MQTTAYYSSTIGTLAIRSTDTQLTYLKFALPDADLSTSQPTAVSEKAITQVNEYLAGQRQQFDLPIQLNGTPFQCQVWQALLKIDYGQTASYQEIARAIGNPKAVRAVGMANNKNPIVLVIPCHRIIGKNGQLVGYAGGLSIKEKLLKLESKHRVI